MSGNIIDMQNDFAMKVLEDEIERLNNEIAKLKVLNKELGGDGDISTVSDEEIICIQEINKLRKISDTDDPDCQLSSDDVKKFDLLNKNLQLIRGNLKRGKGSNLKKVSTAELMKAAKDK